MAQEEVVIVRETKNFVNETFHWLHCNGLDCLCNVVLPTSLMERHFVVAKLNGISFVELLYSEMQRASTLESRALAETYRKRLEIVNIVKNAFQPCENLLRRYLGCGELHYDTGSCRLIDNRFVSEQPHILNYGEKTLLISITLNSGAGLRFPFEKPLLRCRKSDSWLVKESEDLNFNPFQMNPLVETMPVNSMIIYNPMILHSHSTSHRLEFVIPVYSNGLEQLLRRPLDKLAFDYRSIVWLLMRCSQSKPESCLAAVFEWEQRYPSQDEFLNQILSELKGNVIDYQKGACILLRMSEAQKVSWNRAVTTHLRTPNSTYIGN